MESNCCLYVAVIRVVGGRDKLSSQLSGPLPGASGSGASGIGVGPQQLLYYQLVNPIFCTKISPITRFSPPKIAFKPPDLSERESLGEKYFLIVGTKKGKKSANE